MSKEDVVQETDNTQVPEQQQEQQEAPKVEPKAETKPQRKVKTQDEVDAEIMSKHQNFYAKHPKKFKELEQGVTGKNPEVAEIRDEVSELRKELVLEKIKGKFNFEDKDVKRLHGNSEEELWNDAEDYHNDRMADIKAELAKLSEDDSEDGPSDEPQVEKPTEEKKGPRKPVKSPKYREQTNDHKQNTLDILSRMSE